DTLKYFSLLPPIILRSFVQSSCTDFAGPLLSSLCSKGRTWELNLSLTQRCHPEDNSEGSNWVSGSGS
ncbi:MAG: hypothetical protein RLN90_00565, partial [Balneolaceae bacterium]